ncbi:hypothetical protein [Actinoplanes sp. NPDC051494]|uniref:hypothetical protein n=1 Tax=Actinoplanes sp. NPDC051494 TaxID=3363907 RepID=UPI0037A81D80
MRFVRAILVAATAATTTAGVLTGFAGGAAAAGAETLTVPNASFGDGWLDGKLKCWNAGAAGIAKLTVTKKAHSGLSAGYAAGLSLPTGQVVLATDRTDACAIPVTADKSYTLKFWASSAAGAQPVVSSFVPGRGWAEWFRGAAMPASAELRQYAADLPAVPAGVTRLSVGVAFPGASVLVLDDVELVERAGRVSSSFKPTFPVDGLVTNEFTYWNPADPQRSESRDWEMTSGSLFARNGAGYSGKVDGGSPGVRSATDTGSAIFRLNTRDFSFGDVQVSMNLNITGLTSTPRTPTTDWDGVHIFLHYQSQYELYYASVARRDGHVVIKKKCLGGVSNGGAYYALPGSEISGLPFPAASWQAVGAGIHNNADGSVTITLKRDGKIVSTATDNGIGCAPIRAAGASGIRGDNAEFQFSDFTVAAEG